MFMFMSNVEDIVGVNNYRIEDIYIYICTYTHIPHIKRER